MSVTEDLAASYRILADHCVIDAYGHVSVRSSKNPNRYLMARSLAPELVTEDDIVELDLDSNLVDKIGVEIYKERFIHGEIYKLRPEINAVVHNHSPSVIPFGVNRTSRFAACSILALSSPKGANLRNPRLPGQRRSDGAQRRAWASAGGDDR